MFARATASSSGRARKETTPSFREGPRGRASGARGGGSTRVAAPHVKGVSSRGGLVEAVSKAPPIQRLSTNESSRASTMDASSISAPCPNCATSRSLTEKYDHWRSETCMCEWNSTEEDCTCQQQSHYCCSALECARTRRDRIFFLMNAPHTSRSCQHEYLEALSRATTTSSSFHATERHVAPDPHAATSEDEVSHSPILRTSTQNKRHSPVPRLELGHHLSRFRSDDETFTYRRSVMTPSEAHPPSGLSGSGEFGSRIPRAPVGRADTQAMSSAPLRSGAPLLSQGSRLPLRAPFSLLRVTTELPRPELNRVTSSQVHLAGAQAGPISRQRIDRKTAEVSIVGAGVKDAACMSGVGGLRSAGAGGQYNNKKERKSMPVGITSGRPSTSSNCWEELGASGEKSIKRRLSLGSMKAGFSQRSSSTLTITQVTSLMSYTPAPPQTADKGIQTSPPPPRKIAKMVLADLPSQIDSRPSREDDSGWAESIVAAEESLLERLRRTTRRRSRKEHRAHFTQLLTSDPLSPRTLRLQSLPITSGCSLGWVTWRLCRSCKRLWLRLQRRRVIEGTESLHQDDAWLLAHERNSRYFPRF